MIAGSINVTQTVRAATGVTDANVVSHCVQVTTWYAENASTFSVRQKI